MEGGSGAGGSRRGGPGQGGAGAQSPKPRKSGWTGGWRGPKVGGPKFRAVFSLSRRNFRSCFLSRVVFSWNCGGRLGPRTFQIVRLGFSGFICSPKTAGRVQGREEWGSGNCVCQEGWGPGCLDSFMPKVVAHPVWEAQINKVDQLLMNKLIAKSSC